MLCVTVHDIIIGLMYEGAIKEKLLFSNNRKSVFSLGPICLGLLVICFIGFKMGAIIV